MKWRRSWRRAERWSEDMREEVREHVGDTRNMRKIGVAVAVSFALLLALGIYWSREPAPFDVTANIGRTLGAPLAQPVTGAATAATLVRIVDTLLEKPGGFINNDIAPPGLWLDDMPSWERGALQQTRDMARALRDDFGRASANAEPDEDLARAEPRLNFSGNSWMLPSSESQYRDGRDYLRAYSLRLQKHEEPAAIFVATPASLENYLARVTPRLDVLSQRLSACVISRENPLLRSSANFTDTRTTPAGQIDDVFYEARGSAWALLHLLRAIEIDFAPVLREKNARAILREAIRDLDATQDRIYSPIILNGSGFGLVANHSLVMASYMARADSALINLRRVLVEPAPAIQTDPSNTEQETAP